MEQDSVQDQIDYLKSIKKDRPDLYADELGVAFASAVSELYIGSNPLQLQRGRRALGSMMEMVDEVVQDRELSPVFANAFAVHLKMSLSPEK